MSSHIRLPIYPAVHNLFAFLNFGSRFCLNCISRLAWLLTNGNYLGLQQQQQQQRKQNRQQRRAIKSIKWKTTSLVSYAPHDSINKRKYYIKRKEAELAVPWPQATPPHRSTPLSVPFTPLLKLKISLPGWPWMRCAAVTVGVDVDVSSGVAAFVVHWSDFVIVVAVFIARSFSSTIFVCFIKFICTLKTIFRTEFWWLRFTERRKLKMFDSNFEYEYEYVI